MNSQDLHNYITQSLKNRGYNNYSYSSFRHIYQPSESIVIVPVSTNEFCVVQEFEGIESAILKSEDKIEHYNKTGEELIYPIKPLHKGQICMQFIPVINATQIIIHYIIITPEEWQRLKTS